MTSMEVFMTLVEYWLLPGFLTFLAGVYIDGLKMSDLQYFPVIVLFGPLGPALWLSFCLSKNKKLGRIVLVRPRNKRRGKSKRGAQ